MASRNSQNDIDGITWQTMQLHLGTRGLDLRRQNNPETLSECLNARFKDERTLMRREGHVGQHIQDRGAFATDFVNTKEWVYGHGVVVEVDGYDEETIHHPISNVGRGVFEFGDSDVVWTGDRLLVSNADGRFYGESTFWDPDNTETLEHGIPAYLPQQLDQLTPNALGEQVMGVCLTETHQFVAAAQAGGVLTVVSRRDSGQVIDTKFTEVSGEVYYLRIVNSGGTPIVFYSAVEEPELDGDFTLMFWTNAGWSPPVVFDSGVKFFDVCEVPGGCQVIWNSDGQLLTGRIMGDQTAYTPHTFRTELISAPVPDGPCTIAVAPDGDIVWAWVSDGKVYYLSDTEALEQQANPEWDGDWTNGLGAIDGLNMTISWRTLKASHGRYNWVMHVDTGETVAVYELVPLVETIVTENLGLTILRSTELFNTGLLTKSFMVGNEVFAWLRADNSMTGFLRGGVVGGQVCGIADRESCLDPAEDFPLQYGIATDPLADYEYVWLRPFDDGTFFTREQARLGFLSFLPDMSTAKYGKSTYVAGSLVRNWDGQELGDAGFHDYTVATVTELNAGGSLEAGSYRVIAYPVRYNKQGERFQGVAIASDAVTVAVDDAITVSLKTSASSNSDFFWEVYVNYAGGTVFRYAGSVDNDPSVAEVTLVFAGTRAYWEGRPADPHAPNTDGLTELSESGPLGCSILITAGDRLWGAGGQVPAGQAQLSKLYEAGEGAGFDAIAGSITLDAAAGTITSLAAFSDTTVVAFEVNKLFVLTGTGPNNFGIGSYSAPEMVIADGATDHRGTRTLPLGVVYWAEGGPRVLSSGFQTINVSAPIVALSSTLTPTGVHVNLPADEVVWFTETGDAILLNYKTEPRWARWNGLKVAGASSRKLVTTNGRLLTPSDSTPRDDGSRFEFAFATGNVRAEQLIMGGCKFRKVGLVGEHLGKARPYFYLYYDGSPVWSERVRWTPTDKTWLQPMEDFLEMTLPAIDLLGTLDQSGTYGTHWRPSREDAMYLRVFVTDGGEIGFEPWELNFELGVKAGLGRTSVNTMTRG